MKILKKLKVLVSSLLMFSFFSLTNANAMEKKYVDSNKNVSEFKEDKDECETQKEENDKIEEDKSEEANKKQDINIDEEKKEIFSIEKERTTTLKISDNKTEQKRKKPFQTFNIFSGKKTKSSSNIKQSDVKQSDTELLKLESEKNKVKEEDYKSSKTNMFQVVKSQENNAMYKKIIDGYRLAYLSEDILANFENVDFNYIFENIINQIGFVGSKNGLNVGCPFFSIKPYKYKGKMSRKSNSQPYSYRSDLKEHNYDNFSGNLEFYGEDSDLFLEFDKKRFCLGSCFRATWKDIFDHFYPYCFDKCLSYPVFYAEDDGKENEIFAEHIKCYFEFAMANDKDKSFTKACEDLVKVFLSELYLKSLFMSCYREKFDFRKGCFKETIKKFSNVIFKAVTLKFNSDGLGDFNVNFADAINSKEDAELLKNICDAVEKKEENNLLYNLYVATSAFLKKKNFWNKMFGIIVYFNCKNVERNGYENQKELISRKYFDFYNIVCEDMKKMFKNDEQNNYGVDIDGVSNLIEDKFNNESNYDVQYINDICSYEHNNVLDSYIVNFNIDYAQDPDFGCKSDCLMHRFEYIISKLFGKRKKGFFYEDDTWRNYIEDCLNHNLISFNAVDNAIGDVFDNYFNERFKYSFDVDVNFSWIKKKVFDIFFKLKNYCGKTQNEYNLLENNNQFKVSEDFILECLDRAVQNEIVRKECVDLIRYMFNFYVVEGYIKMYGIQGYLDDIFVLRLAEYFNNILDVEFKKNDKGKLRLNLSFKDARKFNIYTKMLNKVILDYKYDAVGRDFEKNATYEEKLVYRFFLMAKSFIFGCDFWNIFLGYLICNKQLNAVRNCFPDDRRLYAEYKKINEQIKGDKTFLNFKTSCNNDGFLKFI